jgi:hypothetical protein
MTDTTKPDEKAIIGGFNQLIRNQRNLRRVRVSSSTSRADLNDALRIAAGHEPQHTDEEPEPQTFPWRSLQTQSKERDT